MESGSTHQLRIIDANFNRIGEGLRVLEEFARLSLNDVVLTGKLKNLRHKILHIDNKLQQRLIGARNAVGDVGAGMEVEEEKKGRESRDMIIANARRVQESLRVLEEIVKEPGVGLESKDYEKARFSLYTIEKELLSKMMRQDKIMRLTGLYVIIDIEFLRGRKYIDVVGETIKGGTKIIQLRDKKDNLRDFYTIALEMQKFCAERDVLFIVNDSLEIALATDADGLHIGRDDLPVAEARRLLPIDKILSASARTVEEAKAAQEAGADYLGVGAMYATATKAGAAVVGPGRIKDIKKSINLPVVAIGGINRENISDVVKAGADAVAVISAVMEAVDIEKATRQLVEIIEAKKRE